MGFYPRRDVGAPRAVSRGRTGQLGANTLSSRKPSLLAWAEPLLSLLAPQHPSLFHTTPDHSGLAVSMSSSYPKATGAPQRLGSGKHHGCEGQSLLLLGGWGLKPCPPSWPPFQVPQGPPRRAVKALRSTGSLHPTHKPPREGRLYPLSLAGKLRHEAKARRTERDPGAVRRR